MPNLETEFDQLKQELDQGGVDAVLERLIAQLREGKQFHELFEALKMRVRHGLGLPLTYSDSGDDLDGDRRNQLEDGLLESCNEVGSLLLADGKAREGWMYLRPVGDKASAAKLLADIEASDENLDELVEVCLHEGVDAKRGYQLVLENYGTCNAITTYEGARGQMSKSDEQAASGLLVEHVHGELVASVVADIARQQGSEPTEKTLKELVADRDWLFGEHAYHLDTTHLASTVRFARCLEDKQQLQLALDLTHYGRNLSSQFQYQGEEPFADLYPSHALYLGALLGENVDEALAYFREKADTADPMEHGSQPIEAYVQLLDRLGRYNEAINALIDYANRQDEPPQITPLLLELAAHGGDYSRVVDYCRDREDLLGYATALAQN